MTLRQLRAGGSAAVFAALVIAATWYLFPGAAKQVLVGVGAFVAYATYLIVSQRGPDGPLPRSAGVTVFALVAAGVATGLYWYFVNANASVWLYIILFVVLAALLNSGLMAAEAHRRGVDRD